MTTLEIIGEIEQRVECLSGNRCWHCREKWETADRVGKCCPAMAADLAKEENALWGSGLIGTPIHGWIEKPPDDLSECHVAFAFSANMT